jgi:hypothetical protein
MAALLVTLPVSAASINLGDGGGLLGGGGSTGDANVTVDTNLLNGSGDDADARINLGDGLLGSGSDPTTADVDLFGSGAGSGGNTGTRVALGTGGTGSNAAALDLFGDGAGAGSDGSGIPGDGSSGNGGGGISGGARTVGTVQIAAATPTPDASKCFAPTAEQQAKLVARHDYTQSVAAWGQVSELKVIDVGLCNSAAASIVAETNIGQLQSYVSSHPEIRAGLDKLGRAPSEVIAGDKSGGTLTLYVM